MIKTHKICYGDIINIPTSVTMSNQYSLREKFYSTSLVIIKLYKLGIF